MDETECSYEQSYDGRRRALAERIEVRSRPERRRRWSSAAKLAIVRETLAAGSTVEAVADHHGIGTELIDTWRKHMLRAAMAGFAAVEIKPDVPVALPGPVQDPVSLPSSSSVAASSALFGGIEVELPSGVRLRFGSDVDGRAVQRILAALAAP